jgi:hypothetical protein
MDQNQTSSLFNLSVDQTGRAHLAETARWAKFLAIIGFIMCGLIVLIGLFFGSIFSLFTSPYSNSPYNDLSVRGSGFGAIMAVYYIVIALIYFFPCLFLYRFANKMKTALASNEQDVLNTSFQNLKASFRYVGIVTIIFLAFFILAFIVGILGVAMGSRM